MSNTGAKMNYDILLGELDQNKLKNCEAGLVGAGLDDGFNHTSELHASKYKEAINGPDEKVWKQEVQNEHELMIKHKVWRQVKKNQVPKGTRILGLVWSMKKTANGMVG